MVGFKIKNIIVLFSKYEKEVNENLYITALGREDSLEFIIADVKEGLWSIYSNGKLLETISVNDDNPILNFNCIPGKIEIVKLK